MNHNIIIKSAREHATTHMQYINNEIQTWRSYSKKSCIVYGFYDVTAGKSNRESHEVDKNEAVCRHTLERDN